MYTVVVIVLMFVAPIVLIIAETTAGHADLWLLVGKWFVFWASGVRLLTAGLSPIHAVTRTGLALAEAVLLAAAIGVWWLRGRPRVHVSHQRVQHPRCTRELQHQVVQARRGGVHLAAPVRPAGRTDGSRRLA